MPPEAMRRPLAWLARLAVAAGMLATIVGGVAALHWRVDAAQVARAPDPLPVATVRAELQPSYTIVERFAGRLEPARQTTIAFERSGLVTEVLADEGDRVEAGAVIARLDIDLLHAERDRLAAQMAQVSANLELANLTAERQRALQRQGHASVQRYDEARLSVVAFEAELTSIQAATRSLDIDIEKSAIRAPFPGIVASRHVDEGAVVSAGTPVMEILEADRPQARIGVSPDVAVALAEGAAFDLSAQGRPLAASISAVRADLATGTRTVTVLLDLHGPVGVPFGEVVDLAVTRSVDTAGYWLPLESLTEGERGLWSVYVAAPAEDGLAVARESVEVVHLAEDRVFVRGTLRTGADVVIGGSRRVIPGQPVVVADAVTATGSGQ